MSPPEQSGAAARPNRIAVITPPAATEPRDESISRPPSPVEVWADRAFRASTLLIAWAVVGLVLYVVWDIARSAGPAIRDYGGAFLTGTTWDANRNEFGIRPAIRGKIAYRVWFPGDADHAQAFTANKIVTVS